MTFRYIIFISLLLVSKTLFASLTPYESRYVLLQDDDRVGSASRVLTRTAENQWRMETKSKARLFLVKIVFNQSADFEYLNGKITPLSFYQLSDTGLTSEKKINQSFDWESGKDIGKYKGKSWSRDLNPGSTSRVADVIQLQLQLQSAKDPIKQADFEVNYRGDSKIDSYVFETKEEIKTPAGIYSALKYKKIHNNPKRVTYYWFVPELDYIPARIQQLHSGSEQANMLLKSIEFK